MSAVDADAIFAAIEKFAATQNRIYKITLLRADASKLERECGSCSKWMTRACPREIRNTVTGRPKGPNCTAPICKEFTISDSWARIIAEKKAEADALAAPTPGGER